MAKKYGKKDMIIFFLILLCLFLYFNCNKTMEGMLDDFELPEIDEDEELSEELLELEEENWDAEFEESGLAANNVASNNVASNNVAVNVPSNAENTPANNVASNNVAVNVPSNTANTPANTAATTGNTR